MNSTNNFEMSPVALLKSYHGADYDFEYEIKIKVGCHNHSRCLNCLVTGFKCIEYIEQEIREWYNFVHGTILFTFSQYKAVDNRDVLLLKLSMHKYDYSIHVVPPTSQAPNGYIGAYLTNRETGRGNDLPDGKYSFCTFTKIIFNILAAEVRCFSNGDIVGNQLEIK